MKLTRQALIAAVTEASAHLSSEDYGKLVLAVADPSVTKVARGRMYHHEAGCGCPLVLAGLFDPFGNELLREGYLEFADKFDALTKNRPTLPDKLIEVED